MERSLHAKSVFANEREKIMKCCAKYDIKQIEVENWIKHNIEDKKDPIHRWNMKQIQECVEYVKWKQMIIDIKNERKEFIKKLIKRMKNSTILNLIP